ncbi:MAG: ion transporter [Bacteroidales bacterium]|nr:ion transporter [Bacteroidales bacterium]
MATDSEKDKPTDQQQVEKTDTTQQQAPSKPMPIDETQTAAYNDGYRSGIMFCLHLVVLLGASLLVALMSYEVVNAKSFYTSHIYLRVEFWVCVIFLIDIALGWFISDNRKKYVISQLPSFLICIPYIQILWAFGIHPSGEWQFVLEFLPILRAVFVLGSVLRTMRFGKSLSMFSAYMLLLLTMMYFASLMFYVAEASINPEIHSFRSAIYWAILCTTTVGSNISEMTTLGEALATVLSAMGLILFPVFTVYISNAVATPAKTKHEN